MSATCPPSISGLVRIRIEDATPTTPVQLILLLHGNVTITPGLRSLDYVMNPDTSYAGIAPRKVGGNLTVISVADARILGIGNESTLGLFDLLNQSGTAYAAAISTAPGGNCGNAEKTWSVFLEFSHDGEDVEWEAELCTFRGPIDLQPNQIVSALEISSQSEGLQLVTA